MNTINLETEVIRENTKILAAEQTHLDQQVKLDAEVDKVLHNADAAYREQLMGELGFDYKLAEAVKIKAERAEFAHLPQNRILGTNAIKAVCIKHGLRFLPTRFYKGALDEGIGAKLEEFKSLNGGKLPVVANSEMCHGSNQGNGGKTQFYIAAPSESFALQPYPRDPLLFCRLNADKFFLLHKWGADLERDGKKHDVTESNWNSVFGAAAQLITGTSAITLEAYQRMLSNVFGGATAATTSTNFATLTGINAFGNTTTGTVTLTADGWR